MIRGAARGFSTGSGDRRGGPGSNEKVVPRSLGRGGHGRVSRRAGMMRAGVTARGMMRAGAVTARERYRADTTARGRPDGTHCAGRATRASRAPRTWHSGRRARDRPAARSRAQRVARGGVARVPSTPGRGARGRCRVGESHAGVARWDPCPRDIESGASRAGCRSRELERGDVESGRPTEDVERRAPRARGASNEASSLEASSAETSHAEPSRRRRRAVERHAWDAVASVRASATTVAPGLGGFEYRDHPGRLPGVIIAGPD
jgi:hypothetical protein